MEAVSNMGGGNGGHDKNSPRWQLLQDPERRGSLPKVLQDILDSLFQYYSDPEALPSLAHLNTTVTNQDGTKRKNRSEAREAECLVMAAIIHNIDLTTLRIGTPIKGTAECLYRSTKELAGMCGLLHPTTGLPLRKFTRAFVRLKNIGFIVTKTVAGTNKKGEIRRRNSAKVATDAMLVALMGGTSAAAAKLKKARDSHSQATKGRRNKTHDQLNKIQKEGFHNRVLNKAKEEKGKAELEVIEQQAKQQAEAMTLLTPGGRRTAYNKAKNQHQNKLLESGLNFAQLHAELRKFPTLENWQP